MAAKTETKFFLLIQQQIIRSLWLASDVWYKMELEYLCKTSAANSL